MFEHLLGIMSIRVHPRLNWRFQGQWIARVLRRVGVLVLISHPLGCHAHKGSADGGLIASALPMDYERILRIGDLARFRVKLSPDDQEFIRDRVPLEMQALPGASYPRRIRHPAGFTISGAVVRTFVKCALVLSAQRVLGRQYYKASDFYDRAASELMLGMTLTHFQYGAPKGAYCCAQCTLAFLPVLEARALRWINCPQLASAVKVLIRRRQWRFSSSTNPRMISWSLSGPQLSAKGLEKAGQQISRSARRARPPGIPSRSQ